MLTRPAEHIGSAPSVELEGVVVGYDGTDALEEISFQIPRGQRVAVVGPNGAGKSTLLRVIAGTLKPTRGTVRVFGHGPGGHVCIAYVPQRSQIDWGFPATVAEVVMMGRVRQIGFLRWPDREDREVVRQALEQVGLPELWDAPIGALSGGQQQRVFLARALAQQAELVLLDEPLTGLDLPSLDAIFQMLDDMRRWGVTVIVAIHDLNLAAERFDQVMLLNRRMIALGPPASVFSSSNLMQAYGSHVHVLPGEGGMVVLTDTCCEGEERDGPGAELVN